jgi:hypothetical protein
VISKFILAKVFPIFFELNYAAGTFTESGAKRIANSTAKSVVKSDGENVARMLSGPGVLTRESTRILLRVLPRVFPKALRRVLLTLC